jgi:hypothetical protein
MIADCSTYPEVELIAAMTNRAKATCSDCYFRRAGLCALPGETACPTFRLETKGRLTPPQQPRLVPRVVAATAAA